MFMDENKLSSLFYNGIYYYKQKLRKETETLGKLLHKPTHERNRKLYHTNLNNINNNLVLISYLLNSNLQPDCQKSQRAT